MSEFISDRELTEAEYNYPDTKEFLLKLHQSYLDNPGEPNCATCWRDNEVTVPFELNEDGDLECPGCGFVIEVKGVE